MKIFKAILEVLFWAFAGVLVLMGAFVTIGVGMGYVLGYVAVVGMVLMLPMVVREDRLLRRRRGATVLSHLQQAVSMNLPLPRMLKAAQQSESGRVAYRIAQLNQRLIDGYPVGLAIDASVPEITPREVSIIQASERLGRLPQALERIVREQATSAKSTISTSMFHRSYPLIVSLVIIGVVGMIAVFVFPKFEQIYSDFRITLPTITRVVFHTANIMGPWLIFAVFLGVVWLAGRSIWETFHGERPEDWLRGTKDSLKWHLPILHGMTRDRGLADAFELIADALEIATPIDRAVAEAAALDSNRMLSRQIALWSSLLSAGKPMHEAAREAGLAPLVVGMLSTVRAPGDAEDVFRFLARYYRSRFSRTAILVQAASVPLIVFFFAGIVLAVALALLLPLVDLIDAIAPSFSP